MQLNKEQLDKQAAIIASGDHEWCYHFASNIEGTDIKALEAVVLASGNAPYCYYFARDVKGADIKALEAVVLASGGDHVWCYHFASNIESADIKALGFELLETGLEHILMYHITSKTYYAGCKALIHKDVADYADSEDAHGHSDRILFLRAIEAHHNLTKESVAPCKT